jgi:hypothetical protein
MATFPPWLCHLQQLAGTLLTRLVDAFHYVGLWLRSPAALAAENLFRRKQLALYQERKVNPRLLCPLIVYTDLDHSTKFLDRSLPLTWR